MLSVACIAAVSCCYDCCPRLDLHHDYERCLQYSCAVITAIGPQPLPYQWLPSYKLYALSKILLLTSKTQLEAFNTDPKP